MKTVFSFSCIHVRNCPNNLVVTSFPPPSPPTPAKAFSISSIQRTQGLMASDSCSAFRIFCSDSPTYFPKSLPTSNRTNGISNKLAVAFAVKLFPHPGIPIIMIPLGTSTPNLIALSKLANTLAFFFNHSFKFSKPPISSIVSVKLTISSIPAFFINCSFSLSINSLSSLSMQPPSWYAKLRICFIWNSFKPLNDNAISSMVSLSTVIFKSSIKFSIIFNISVVDGNGISNTVI